MKQLVLVLVLVIAMLCLMAGAAYAEVLSAEADGLKIFTLVDVQGEADTKLLIGASEEQIARYVPSGKLKSQILAFLVKLKNYNILFDTGIGEAKGGKMMSALKDLGIAPSDINLIFLTHLHGDHYGGLVNKSGEAAFPNADVYVSRIERIWWLDERNDSNVRKALALYGKRLHVFEFGEQLLPKIKAIDTSGHTPGHTAFHVKSSGGKGEILIVGDIMHFADIQLPLPNIAVTYDVDKAKAPEARKFILDTAAENNIPIAGMHCPVPGVWRINKNGSGYERTALN